MTKTQKLRIVYLTSMDEYITKMDDDTIHTIWFTVGLSKNHDDKEVMSYAMIDDNWKYICTLFGKLTYKKEEI